MWYMPDLMAQPDPIRILCCITGCLSHVPNVGKVASVLSFEAFRGSVKCREEEQLHWMGRTAGKSLAICTSQLTKPARMYVLDMRPRISGY
jgi:hypothetical protein